MRKSGFQEKGKRRKASEEEDKVRGKERGGVTVERRAWNKREMRRREYRSWETMKSEMGNEKRKGKQGGLKLKKGEEE